MATVRLSGYRKTNGRVNRLVSLTPVLRVWNEYNEFERTEPMNTNVTGDDNPIDRVAQGDIDIENADTDEIVSELCHIVRDQQEQLEQKDDKIDDLENELADYREFNEEDKADIRNQVSEIDDKSTGNGTVLGKLHDKVDNVKEKLNNSPSDESALEQIVRIPSELAQDSLTKNQNRAREIVTNLTDVKTEKAMNGSVIVPSTAIREYLVDEYGHAHYQTVHRIMDFIADMAGADARVRKNGDDPWLKDGGSSIHAVAIDSNLVKSIRGIEPLQPDEIDGLTNAVRPNLSVG